MLWIAGHLHPFCHIHQHVALMSPTKYIYIAAPAVSVSLYVYNIISIFFCFCDSCIYVYRYRLSAINACMVPSHQSRVTTPTCCCNLYNCSSVNFAITYIHNVTNCWMWIWSVRTEDCGNNKVTILIYIFGLCICIYLLKCYMGLLP